MTKKKATKATAWTKLSSRRKALKGKFLKTKVAGVSISHKFSYDDRWSYDNDTVWVRDGYVRCKVDGWNQGKLTIESFKELIEEFSNKEKYRNVDFSFNLYLSYRANKYTYVSYSSSNFKMNGFAKIEKELKDNKLDLSKATISIYGSTFERKMTDEELAAVNECVVADEAAAEKRKIAQEKAEAKYKKEEAERQARLKLERAEREARERRVKDLEDTQDLAMALKILEERGLQVVVVKDGKAMV